MKEFTTYLIFNGNCRQAMTFYQKCLGGAELQMLPFSDSPSPNIPEEAKDWVMHARLSKGDAVLMASDNMPGMEFHQGNNFMISITCESAEEVDKLFNALGDKGKVTMPLQETFWAARFGMLVDQFGVGWMFNLDKAS